MKAVLYPNLVYFNMAVTLLVRINIDSRLCVPASDACIISA